MIYDLNTGAIDCAVCTGRPANRDIDRLVLRKYRDCIVFSPTHRFARKKSIRFEELKDERFAVIARSQARRGYEEVRARSREAGFDASIEERGASVAHLLSLVASGRYVPLLSDNYKGLAAGKLSFVPLADRSVVELAFLWDKTTQNPCVPPFAEYIRNTFKKN